MEKLSGFRRFILMGIIVIALGITFSTSLGDNLGSLGTVLIAVGSLLFIVGMSRKRKEDESNENDK